MATAWKASRIRLSTVVRSAYGCGVALFGAATLWGQGGSLRTEQRTVLAGRIAAGVRQAAAEQTRPVSVSFVGDNQRVADPRAVSRARHRRADRAHPPRGTAFLRTLTSEQRRTIAVPVENDTWRRWVVTGLLLPAAKAIELLEASLSARDATELRQHYASIIIRTRSRGPQQAAVERPESQAEVEAFAVQFLSAIANADWDSFRKFWSDDATMYAPGPTDAVRIEGIEALQRVWQRQFDLMRGAALDRGVKRPPFVTLVARDLRVDHLAPDVAVVSFHLDDDGRMRRRTLVVAKRGSQWRITHLHASDLAGQTTR